MGPTGRGPAVDPSAKQAGEARFGETADAHAVCPNCGAHTNGAFCPACGEDLRPASERALRSRLRHWREGRPDQPSYLRTFAALVTGPGQLTLDFLRGRRRRYLRPLQLFLLCNVFYFFVQPLVHMNMLSTPLRVHMSDLPYSGFAAGLVNEAVARRGVDWTLYRVMFDTTLDHLARTLVIAMVPMLAAALAVVYWRRAPFGAHAVFALHFYAFALLTAPLLGMLALGLSLALRGVHANDVLLSLIPIGPFSIWLVYLYLAQRRVYGQARWVTLARTAVLGVMLIVVLTLYRFMLFLLTFYSV